MTKRKLNSILKKHKLWLTDNTKGERAILSGADLSKANLFGANLSEADLFRADLSGANLSVANLFGTYLSEANLSGANLSEAYLFEANLSRANLSEANLSRADLFRAILSGANLFKANISRADFSYTNIISFCLGKDFGFYHEGLMKIGCLEYKIDYWLKNAKEIGKANNYSKKDISLYVDIIKIIKKHKKGKQCAYL